MSICASGASRAKATSAASVVVDSAYVKSLLPAALAWLYDYLPAFERLELGNVGTFCASDPPTWTLPTSAELFSYLTGGPIGNHLQIQKFIGDVARAYIWYQLCECTSGATPSPPAAPSPPANLPAVNPPGVVNLPLAAPCFTQSINGILLCGGNAFTAADFTIAGMSATATRFKVTNNLTSGVGFAYTMSVAYLDVGGATIRVDSTSVPGASSSVDIIGPGAPSNAYRVTFRVVGTGGAGCGDVVGAAQVFCNGNSPTAPISPCCPPDPVLTARVNQILDMVTLIQRQAVPFGYVAGASHAGLTGSGALSVSGLLGCKVDMTTIPASYGQSVGTPVEHFDLGFVTFGSPDGYPSSMRLEHQPTLFLPARCGAYTDLAYSLSPGVVATITELLRES